MGTTWTVAFSKDKNDDIVGTGHQKSEKIRKKDKSKERFKKDKTKPKKKKSETSSSSDSSIARSDKKQKK